MKHGWRVRIGKLKAVSIGNLITARIGYAICHSVVAVENKDSRPVYSSRIGDPATATPRRSKAVRLIVPPGVTLLFCLP